MECVLILGLGPTRKHDERFPALTPGITEHAELGISTIFTATFLQFLKISLQFQPISLYLRGLHPSAFLCSCAHS